MTVTVPREVDAKYLWCYVQPRYWEDTEINEQADDEDGTLVHQHLKHLFPDSKDMIRRGAPENRSEGFICIPINLDNGTVEGWPGGVTASFGYKSVDNNIFILEDDHGSVIYRTPKGDTEYVIGPKFMNDYGDYFVLQVEEDGSIVDWNQKEMIAALQIWMGEIC